MTTVYSMDNKRGGRSVVRPPSAIRDIFGREKSDLRSRINLLRSTFASIGADIRSQKESAAGRSAQVVPPEPTLDDFLFVAGRLFQAAMGDGQALSFCRAKGIAVTRSAGESSNAVGAVLVPEEIEDVVIALREQYGALRASIQISNMRRDSMMVPRRTSGLTAGFTGENSTLTEGSLAFDGVNLVSKKLTVFTRVSNELGKTQQSI